MLAKFSVFNPKGPYLSFKQEKENFGVVFKKSWQISLTKMSVNATERNSDGL